MVLSLVRWCAMIGAMLIMWSASAVADNRDNDLDNDPLQDAGNDDYLIKQVVWKRCYRKLSPACLKLSLVRTVEMMSRDSSFFLLPGVYFSSNSTGANPLPPDIARSLSSDQASLDELVAFSLRKYLRSLTLNINLVDFVSGGNKTLQNSVIDAVTGRKKEGLGGYGAIAAMMGGMMATMMMAALAALAGKAMMTSLAALMMAAFAAMKGGGGGDHESKTYEVITKPIVSHVNTHSSEVQHEHHGHYHKRSLALGRGAGKPDVGGQETVQGRVAEDRYGWRSFQPEAFEYHQLYKHNDEDFLDLPQPNTNHFKRSVDLEEDLKPSTTKKKDINKRENINENGQSFSYLINHEHLLQKRSIETQNPKESESASKVVPDNVDQSNPVIGHPRQNYRQQKRHVDDVWALGLFR